MHRVRGAGARCPILFRLPLSLYSTFQDPGHIWDLHAQRFHVGPAEAAEPLLILYVLNASFPPDADARVTAVS